VTREHLLELEEMTVTYAGRTGDVVGLDRVSLGIAHGEMVGIIGESGSGKTTLARAMLGLLGRNASCRGSVRFAGEQVYADGVDRLAKLRGDRIGMVFQAAASSLDPVARVGFQLREVLRAHRSLSRRDAGERARNMLRRLGFEDPDRVMASYPHELSGGMCQRVAIAAAAVAEPDLVIADECTSAFDVTTQAEVIDVFRSIARLENWALVFVTHDILLAAELCSRLVVMYAGQIVEDGDVRQVIESPRHPYTQALIDAVPLWGPKSPLRGISGSPPRVVPGLEGCRFAVRCPLSVEECSAADVGWTRNGDGHGYRCIRPLNITPPTTWE
jgi:oligopeptide/dipeptide ABC transporter ATP-binding protein